MMESLDSFAIPNSIVGELEDEFDVSATPADIIPENFNSVNTGTLGCNFCIDSQAEIR